MKSRGGKSQRREEKRRKEERRKKTREEKEPQETARRNSQKKEDAGGKKVKKKSRSIMFLQCFGAPDGQKVRLLKRRAWSHLARREWKSLRRCGAKRISKPKCTKHTILRALFEVRMWFCMAGARDSEWRDDVTWPDDVTWWRDVMT